MVIQMRTVTVSIQIRAVNVVIQMRAVNVVIQIKTDKDKGRYCGLKVLCGQCWTSLHGRQGSKSLVKFTLPL